MRGCNIMDDISKAIGSIPLETRKVEGSETEIELRIPRREEIEAEIAILCKTPIGTTAFDNKLSDLLSLFLLVLSAVNYSGDKYIKSDKNTK